MKKLQLEPFEAICGKRIACKAVTKEINYVESTGTLNKRVVENWFRIPRMVTKTSKGNEVYGDHFLRYMNPSLKQLNKSQTEAPLHFKQKLIHQFTPP